MFNPEGLVGKVLDGKYRLAEFLGEGTFGWVYSADMHVGGRARSQCAIKVMRPKTPDLREAVWRELEAMGQLSHQGLVQFRSAFDVSDGELAGVVCLVMELCEGTLSKRLQAGRRLAVDEARGVARDLSEVLAWLHGQGVVHRDLKPDNVFCAGNRWKLGDLGLVRAVEGSLVSASGFKGSPQYMSPEALAGKVSTASDVWSLGALLQEALTGTPVYSGATVPELILASASQEPTIAPDLPSPFDAVVRGCLVKDPRLRWTAQQVLEALDGSSPAVVRSSVVRRPRSAVAAMDAPTVDSPVAATLSTAQARRPDSGAASSPSSRRSAWLAVTLVGLVLGVVLWMAAFGGPKPDPGSDSPPPSVVQPGSSLRGLVALGRNAQGRERFQVEGGGPVLVSLPAGRFRMGSPAGEEGRDSDETHHEVVLSRGFLIGETEVTQAEYAAVVGANPSGFQDLDRPVEQVSWFDAVSFCNALSRRVGLEKAYVVNGTQVTWKGLSCPGFRLPTEAEWEYACRAGTTGARYGDLDDVAWYDGNSRSTTHPVRRKQPNAWGLYDTLGNVFEWCWDWYASYPSGVVTDPVGPASGSGRVDRGGSWGYGAQYARAASRIIYDPDYRGDYLGFRLARSLP